MKNSMMPATPSPLVRSLRTAGPLAPLVGLTLLTLSLVACGGGSAPSASTPPVPLAGGTTSPGSDVNAVNPDIALVPFSYDGQDHSWADSTSATVASEAITNGNNDLSAQSWSSATSGWGPVELNRSNGEKGGSDGNTITLDGKTYTTGLGVHSASTITYDLNGQCAGFQSDMGIDDEVRSLGSVTFEIWVDGSKVYDSGYMTGATYRKFTSVDLRGKNQLKLVVTNGGDNADYDHADWAGATLLGCTIGGGKSSVAPTPPAAVSNVISYSGPLVITKGGTYSGNWESQDVNTPVIYVQTSEPVTIENSNLRGKAHLILGFGNRLTVRNVKGYALNSNILNKGQGNSIAAIEVRSLDIENSYFEGTNGIYLQKYIGDPSKGETIKIIGNKMKNINGRPSDGNGGYLAKESYEKHAHAIQFNEIQKVPGVEIAWNEVINEPDKSAVEENFNLYQSSGTIDSPIRVHDNYIQGGYNANPTTDPAYSGGGILLGDGYVTDPSLMGNSWAYNNQVVNTTNEGMAIVAGNNSKIYSNRIISSGLTPDGRRVLAQNVGLYIWDILSAGKSSPATFYNNSIYDNYVAWTRVDASGKTSNNPYWLNECGNYGTYCSNNISGGTATQDTVLEEYQLWLKKTASNNIKVGPNN